ncbi:MAG: hypothetical protein IKB05_03695 [Alphaproteobacteria bacterium]|nr:hypothetical protein [Alphaproteobacteria bacterium]MBR3930654.1 hypothetical protein [Alphaproteobacteria bacterium]
MSEKTLFLLKPDALQLSLRTLLAKIEFYKQLKANDLSVLATAKFVMTYDMLIGYQPVLDPNFKSEMTTDWKDMTLDYQLGKDRQGLEHLLVVVEGYDALAKGPTIKRHIRNKYCSPWDKYAPGNLIHAPDDNEEYEKALYSFESVLKSKKAITDMEMLYNTRRKK